MTSFDQCSKRRLAYLAIFIIFLFSFEYFLREILWNITLFITPWLQSNLKFFISFEHSLSFFGSERVFIVVIFLVFLFCNIYKTFILIAVVSSANFLTGILKMIYAQPRPYWVSEAIIPYQCEGGWASPSGHSLCSVAFYLTLWRLIFFKQNDKQQQLKSLSLLIIMMTIALICFGRVFLGVHAINQVFLGCSLGWSLYYLTFYILNIDPDNPYQLLPLITKNFKHFFLINTLLVLVYSSIYFTVVNSNRNKLFYNDVINTKGCSEIGQAKRFENDAYLSCTMLHMYLAGLIGIYIEYSIIFNSNMKKWIEYNFGQLLTAEHERLLHKNTDCQWNHTKDNATTVKRSILTIIFWFVMMIPMFVISNDAAFLIVVLFKIFIPSMVSFILMFSYFKVFLANSKATNENTYDNFYSLLMNTELGHNITRTL